MKKRFLLAINIVGADAGGPYPLPLVTHWTVCIAQFSLRCIRHMKTFSFLAILLVICGCQTTEQSHTRLTRAQAIGIAKELAIEHNERLADYRPPEVEIRGLNSDQWQLWFFLKKSAIMGKPETWRCFRVIIDDKTGVAKYDPMGLH